MADLENRVSHLETKVSVIETKVDMFIDEMRQQNAMRAAEIRELREQREKDNAQREADLQKMREQREKDNAKHEAAMAEINKKIDDKFDKISNQIQIMSISMILGVGAIVWAVVSALK